MRATHIPRGSAFISPNGTTQVATQDRIEYQLTNDRLRDEAGILEWTLILEDGLIKESAIDPGRAVNSIEYIIANQLLEAADNVRLSFITQSGDVFTAGGIITNRLDSDGNNPAPPPRVVTLSTPPTIARPVPYNNTIAPSNDTIPYVVDTRIQPNGLRQFTMPNVIGDGSLYSSSNSQSKDVDLYKVQLNAGEIINIDIDGYSLNLIGNS